MWTLERGTDLWQFRLDLWPGIDEEEEENNVTTENEDEEEEKLLKDQNDEIRIIRNSALERVRTLLSGKATTNKLVDDKGKVLLKKGDILSIDIADVDVGTNIGAKLMTEQAEADKQEEAPSSCCWGCVNKEVYESILK